MVHKLLRSRAGGTLPGPLRVASLTRCLPNAGRLPSPGSLVQSKCRVDIMRDEPRMASTRVQTSVAALQWLERAPEPGHRGRPTRMRSDKGSRKIVVEDVEYRWRAKGDDGYIRIGIWPANKVGPYIKG